MDLGGASTQITFETTRPSEDPDSEVHLRLYGQHYRVYTHSFLCYGRDQVLKRLLASALQVPFHTSASLRKGGRTKGNRAEAEKQLIQTSRTVREASFYMDAHIAVGATVGQTSMVMPPFSLN